MKNPFVVKAYQVFAFALSTGPKMSTSNKVDSLSLRFYGRVTSINTRYNELRKEAVADGIIVKGDLGLYELGPKGVELLAWAKEQGLDLSTVRTVSAQQWAAKQKLASEGAAE